MPYLLLIIGAVIALSYTKGEDIMDTVTPYLSDWNKYDAWFKYYASINNLPANGWKWLKAIALNESSLGKNPLVVAKTWSTDGLSRGLMQLVVLTANDYGKWYEPNSLRKSHSSFNSAAYNQVASYIDDDETSIKIATQHFARIYRKFNGNLEYAVKAYNQGEGNMSKEIAARAAGSTTGYAEAQKYWERFQRNLASVESKP